MAEEIDFENGRNSNFEGLVTLTLTFDPAIRHIVLQQSSTCTYIPTFIQIEETFCGRTDVRTDGRTYGRADGHFSLYIIRSTFGSRPKNGRPTRYDQRRNNLEWLSEIFNDTKHRAVSLRQLSFLLRFSDVISNYGTYDKAQVENADLQVYAGPWPGVVTLLDVKEGRDA